MVHAQAYYCGGGLGSTIKLNYQQNIKHYKGYSFYTQKEGAGFKDEAKAQSLTEKELGSADLMVYIGKSNHKFKISPLYSACL